jgi:SAM-dependent methyltransferase
MPGKFLGTIKRVVTTIGVSDPRPNTYLAKLFHKPRYDEIISIVKKYMGNTIEILVDVGCGRGALYELLSKAGVKVDLYVCCDIQMSYLRKIEGERVERILCDAHNLPFKEGAADLVVCSEVLEHLEKPLKALYNMLYVARERVLITFPNEKIKNALGFRYPEHISEIELNTVVYFADYLDYKVELYKRLYFAFPPSILDKMFEFSHQKLKFFSAFLGVLSSLLREFCLIKTEILLLEKKIKKKS